MTLPATDKVFAGSIPKIYDTYLVPLIFQAYADDLARRTASLPARQVLEVAAGSGVVTRALAAALPADVEIVSTDLNPAMIEHAKSVGTQRAVEWSMADAMQLPFDDDRFDVVVCQFGAMFFPDKAHAFAEARRVLRPGGVLVFNVWDRIEENEFTDVVTNAVAALFPDDPPRFLARTPHGYHDKAMIRHDVAQGGFRGAPEIVTVTETSRAASPRIPAVAFCQGTPLRSEIETRSRSRLEEATTAAEHALARHYGTGAVEGRIQAHVVTVEA